MRVLGKPMGHRLSQVHSMAYGTVAGYRNYTQGLSSQNLLMGNILRCWQGFVVRFMGNILGVYRT